MDHRRAPILEALAAYHAADFASFCIPAHKQGRALDAETRRIMGAAPFRDDVLMHKGLDDRTGSKGVMQAAQELAADAFGADRSFFSTNGSTLSVQTAVIAGARPGEKILVQRNAHKSAVAGVVHSGADVIWVDPDIDDDRSLGHAALADHPDARAALCVSPSYYGVAADVGGLAEVCHRHGIPLLIDGAWGADFHFHPELPAAAMDSGADLAIGSFHKSLGGLLQSSIVSVQGDLLDVERLQLALDSMETTSTSSLMLASIDAARREMALHGEELLGRTLRIARRVADHLRAVPGLGVMGGDVTDRPGTVGLDETKITVDLHDLGITGYDAADWLYDQRRVAVEGVDYRHLMFIVTIGDDDGSGDRLVGAVTDLASMAREQGRPSLPPMAFTEALFRGARYPMPPRDAFLGRTRHAKLADAAGEIAAEPVSPYPPGVPVVVPGQHITSGIVEFLRSGMELGMYVEGASDPSLAEIRVVDAP
jgi:arginine/lysine/ornithine decarboxylase